MNKKEKAEKLISDDMIFDAQETDRILLYICKGFSGKLYEVIYDKLEDKYLCRCNNIRNNMCYHKLAAHKLRTGDWYNEDSL